MAINKKIFDEKLVEFLQANNLNMSILNNKSLGRDSIWAQITTSIYGSYNNLKTLELYKAWKTNRNIKQSLNNVLNGKI
jgi:hypothetical protein